MYQKSLWEKFGDLFSSLGKRCLIGLAIAILGGVFAGLDPTGTMGFVFCFGVLLIVSILESSKTFFVANIIVRAPTGEIIPCAILKQNRHAYMPVVPFFSLFFYLPYKTDYYLLKNVSAPELQCGTRVNGTLLDAGLVRMEQITKAKAIALQKDPQIIAQELSGQAEQARYAFLNEVKPFFDTKLLEEIFPARHLSVCNLEGMCILFHYAKIGGRYCGMHINADYVNRIKQDPSFLLGTYLSMEPEKLVDNLVILDDTVLERLLRIRKGKTDSCSNINEQTITEPPEVISRVNQNKITLTKDVIEQALKKSSSTPKKALGLILCFPALGAIELGIAGIVTGGVIWGLLFLALGIWLAYVAIKKLKQSSKNKESTLRGQYKILQTTCSNTSKEVREDEDGTVTFYTTKFANGEIKTMDRPLGVEGDTFYLVYLPGSDKADVIFNGIDYIPSPDLIIEHHG